ncbi:MAG: GYF domain-containing protein [Thermodesulfovibrionales bacterium]|nr:GYF domain-containing protein [Thermodesulfovibrionales bacterium]
MINNIKNNKDIWFVLKSGRKEGPYHIEDIKKMIGLNQINPKTFLWKPGLTNWMAANSFQGLFVLAKIESNIQSQFNANIVSPSNQSDVLSESVKIDPTFTNTNKSIDLTSKQSVKRSKRPSYISRHWHGDLSLPISFWVNGVFLNLLLLSLIKFVPWNNMVNVSPKIYSIIVILLWFFLAPISIWQLIGIWNSSSSYIKSGKSKFTGNFVKFIIILNLLNLYSTFAKTGIPQVKEYFNIAIGNDLFGDYQIRVLRDASELEIYGPITFGLSDDVRKILNAHPSIKIIHLNSIGGRVFEARKLRDLIYARNLSTYTSSGCSSACTLAFMGGHKRLIAKNAYLGFHQYGFPGLQQPDFNNEYNKDKQDWRNRGVSESFIEKAYTTPNSEMWKPSHKELLDANFITEYPENDEIAISGFQLKDIENIETGLAKDPLYSSIKKYEPKTYNQLISEIKLTLQKGKSLAELQQVIRPYLISVLYKRLPYAADNLLFEFIKVFLEQMQILYKINPDICFNYIFGNDRDKSDIVKYFPKELVQKEFNVISEIIQSSSIQSNQFQNKKQIEAQFIELVKKLTESHGEDIELLANPEMRNMNKARSCQLTYDLYNELLKLPLKEFGEILRYLLAQGMK